MRMVRTVGPDGFMMVFIVLVNAVNSAVLISGIGILGRWRDGTEPSGTGVTGPFWLWPRATQRTESFSEDGSESDSSWVDTDSHGSDTF